jgi:hypothetical protein
MAAVHEQQSALTAHLLRHTAFTHASPFGPRLLLGLMVTLHSRIDKAFGGVHGNPAPPMHPQP